MGNIKNKILLAIPFLMAFLSSFALAGEPQPIDGTYDGVMSLTDGSPQSEVPLSVALTTTDELEKVETNPGVFEMVKVIDGNFLVDKEGGPFAFNKVRYRIETSEIDLKYTRTKGVTVGQPPSYRLFGRVFENGDISGRVLSGFSGQIGTFKLSKSKQRALKSIRQYVGAWAGASRLMPEGDLERFGITIAPTGFSTINPDQFDFDYTLGKLAHLDLDIVSVPLSNVSIDYIHRKITMTNAAQSTEAAITVEAELDFKTNHLKGTYSTIYGGRRGEFDLEKIRDGG